MQNTSNIIKKQLHVIFKEIESKLEGTSVKEEKDSIVNAALRKFFMHTGGPLTEKRQASYGHLPYIENYNENAKEIIDDISIAYEELEQLGNTISEAFNYGQNEKTKLKNRINELTSKATTLNILSNEDDKNVVHFKDSFNDYDMIDTLVSAGKLANISTSEGILTLAKSESIDYSQKAKISTLSGNGEAGNYHIARRADVSTEDGNKVVTAQYKSEENPNDIPGAMIDARPDTWFEYQMVNIPEEEKEKAQRYDIQWAKGRQHNDNLKMRAIVDIGEVVDLNWINIDPYLPENSESHIKIHSIKTSSDGIDYIPIGKSGVDIHSVSHSYQKDELFLGYVYDKDKASLQGMLWFAPRKARYIEVIVEQNHPYTELIGHTYYKRISAKEGVSSEIRVPSTSVPEEIVHGEPGRYPLDNDQYILKGINLIDGWRYYIGIRSIGINNYRFAQKSEIITKPLKTSGPIKEITLYANEVIPDVFLQELKKANDWVRYYISIDDVHWHRISPMHHQAIAGRDDFPPKIYKVNSNEVLEDKAKNPYRGYLYTDSSVTSIRVKIVLSRPADIENADSYTPILEDYALRVLVENELGGVL